MDSSNKGLFAGLPIQCQHCIFISVKHIMLTLNGYGILRLKNKRIFPIFSMLVILKRKEIHEEGLVLLDWAAAGKLQGI